jgi:hypothetical protein
MNYSNFRAIIFFTLMFLAQGNSFSQQARKPPLPPDEGGYKSEFVYGLNFNTIGGLIGGLYFKYAKLMSPKHYHHFGLEMNYVKSNAEKKDPLQSGNYNYDKYKKNYLFALRPMYGHELRVFKKASDQGIQVNLIGGIGPTFGILAPYLVEYKDSTLFSIRPNTPDLKQNQITRTGFISESISRASVMFGGSLKLASTFEFGVYKQNVSGIEIGYMLDVYSSKVPIMYEIENKAIMSSVYLTFYYGFRKQ